MSNSLLNRLYMSILLVPVQRRYRWEMSEHQRLPVKVFNTDLGVGFNTGRREGNYIRRISHCFARSNHE